ncbi:MULTISPECIES: hypothetical protein [Halorubrum]|nr:MULTISPECIES: hypothetical protein [Halorubrum]
MTATIIYKEMCGGARLRVAAIGGYEERRARESLAATAASDEAGEA